MRLTAGDLVREAARRGLHAEQVEVVARILEVLGGIAAHPRLRNSVALKGGAAIHLFELDIARFSKDIDLNLLESAASPAEGPQTETAMADLREVCRAAGVHFSGRWREEHALAQWRGRFALASGRPRELTIDLQRQSRVSLEPVRFRSPTVLPAVGARGVPVVGLNELAAEKAVALLNRGRPRDMFDLPRLLERPGIDLARVSTLTVVLSSATKSLDLRRPDAAVIACDVGAILTELGPVVPPPSDGAPRGAAWARAIHADAGRAVDGLLPLTDGARRFLDALLDEGRVAPELLTDDPDLAARVARHPAVRFRAANASAYHARRRRPAGDGR